MNQTEKADYFGTLHRKGTPVILYNIWDAGTAKAVTEAGAKALATGSWSVAAANGYGDGQKLPMDVLIETARTITAVNDLPLSVDFEGGYSTEPAGAAAARLELLYDVELDLHHGYDDQLRDAVERLEGERRLAAVPH